MKTRLIPTVVGLMTLLLTLPLSARNLQEQEQDKQSSRTVPAVAAKVVPKLAAKGVGLPASERLREIFAGGEPKTVADLREMQAYQRALLAKILPAMCSIGSASGVMIKGGYALTAGHVTKRANVAVRIVLHGGKSIKGRTLGANYSSDTGLVKITSKGDFAALEMGTSKDLKPGQWCVMMGHPGGWKKGRMASIRIGRILRKSRNFIVSDCTMTPGDSGGPLFDMQGRVIGINSRISGDLATNMHVPIDAFHKDWQLLISGKTEGTPINSFRGRGRGRGRSRNRPSLGIERDPDSDEVKILKLQPGTSAARSKLEVGDIIKKIDGRSVSSWRSLSWILRRRRPGQEVKLTVKRGEKTLEIPLTLGSRQR